MRFYSHSPWDLEAGRPEVQGHPSKKRFKASLGCLSLCVKNELQLSKFCVPRGTPLSSCHSWVYGLQCSTAILIEGHVCVYFLRSGQRAVSCPAAKPEDLSSASRTRMAGENWLLQAVLWSQCKWLHMLGSVPSLSCTHTVNKIKSNFFFFKWYRILTRIGQTGSAAKLQSWV